MATTTLVSVEEYLSTTYDPDCDYVEGRLEERNVGELDHGDIQTSCASYVRTQCRGYWAVVEVRVQIRPDRFRIPDVSIVKGTKPSGRIFTSPPHVAVEVVSPDDRVSRMQEKIDDYLTFGIPYVWVIYPESRRAYIYTNDGAREAKDGILRAGELQVPLSALFSE